MRLGVRLVADLRTIPIEDDFVRSPQAPVDTEFAAEVHRRALDLLVAGKSVLVEGDVDRVGPMPLVEVDLKV